MSKGNRAAAQGVILNRMRQLDPSGRHHDHYQELLTKMSNEEFDNFMTGLISGKIMLTAYFPNYDEKAQITTANNIKLAKDMGYNFFQRIWITDPVTGVQYLTPRPHMVYTANVCRQIQTLDHKISVPEKNGKINELTGQVRSDSRASQISGPEMMVLNSKGLTDIIVEGMKLRGGDIVSNRQLNHLLHQNGEVSIKDIPAAPYERNRSVQTLSVILNGMMFGNNFAG